MTGAAWMDDGEPLVSDAELDHWRAEIAVTEVFAEVYGRYALACAEAALAGLRGGRAVRHVLATLMFAAGYAEEALRLGGDFLNGEER